jgi:hypothetical protein
LDEQKDITIVILGCDRNEHLYSTINYYQQFNFNLLVLHNSKRSLDINNTYKNLVYINCDKNYAERSLIAKNLVKTPYAILSSDDERYLPYALVNMAKTLKNNSKVKSVGAQALAIYLYGRVLCASRPYQYNYNYSNQNTDLSLRIFKHFKNAGNNVMFSSMYRMYRTNDFKKILNLFYLNKKISTPYIMEVTSEIFSLNLGGIQYLNELLWVRNWIVEPISNSIWNRSLTFTEWYESTNYEDEKNQWQIKLANELEIDCLDSFISQLLMNRKFEIRQDKKRRKLKFMSYKYKYYLKKIIDKSFEQNFYQSQLSYLKNANIHYNTEELKVAVESMLLPFKINLKNKI